MIRGESEVRPGVTKNSIAKQTIASGSSTRAGLERIGASKPRVKKASSLVLHNLFFAEKCQQLFEDRKFRINSAARDEAPGSPSLCATSCKRLRIVLLVSGSRSSSSLLVKFLPV